MPDDAMKRGLDENECYCTDNATCHHHTPATDTPAARREEELARLRKQIEPVRVFVWMCQKRALESPDNTVIVTGELLAELAKILGPSPA